MEKQEQSQSLGQALVKYFAKGSGSTFCLLNGSSQDQIKFIPYDLKQYLKLQGQIHIKDISMAGLYLMLVTSNGDVFGLGMFGLHIFKHPTIINFSTNKKVKIKQVSSGWDHSVFKSQNQVLYGVGSNKFQQLGLSVQKKFAQTPQQLKNIIDKPGKIDAFQCGFRQTYYSRNNKIFGCGQSKKYQLGIQSCKNTSWIQLHMSVGNQLQKQGYLQKSATIVFKKIKCSKKAAFFLSQTNQLYVLGFNEHNIFNLRNKQVKFLQKLTKTMQNVVDVSCGWSHCIIVKCEEEQRFKKSQYFLESYGRNIFFQLGRNLQNQNCQNKQKIVFNFNSQHTENTKIEQKLCNKQIMRFDQLPKVVCGTQFSFCISGDQAQMFGWGWNQHHNIIQSQQQKFIKQPKLVPIQMMQCQKFKFKRVWTYPAITIVQCETFNKNKS